MKRREFMTSGLMSLASVSALRPAAFGCASMGSGGVTVSLRMGGARMVGNRFVISSGREGDNLDFLPFTHCLAASGTGADPSPGR
jgi:hypothetical protein